MVTDDERAQSASFVTRFIYPPTDYTVTITEQDGRYEIEDMAFLRYVLNECRPLIQNERDSVYYQKVHSVWYRMLMLDDENRGAAIRVFDRSKTNVTARYIQWLSEIGRASCRERV